MNNITSLSDVINALNLDVYKRILMSELKDYENNIDPKKKYNTMQKCNKIMNQFPPISYVNQPENTKFFLPPIPDLLKMLNMTEEEQNKYQELENNKRQNETLKFFSCEENFLVAVYQDKNNDYVFYTYNYDYEYTNSLNLMSRVVYR